MKELRRWQLWMTVPGVMLMALGWGLGNFYLVAAGSLLLCGVAAMLTIPRPPREPGEEKKDKV